MRIDDIWKIHVRMRALYLGSPYKQMISLVFILNV